MMPNTPKTNIRNIMRKMNMCSFFTFFKAHQVEILYANSIGCFVLLYKNFLSLLIFYDLGFDYAVYLTNTIAFGIALLLSFVCLFFSYKEVNPSVS